MDENLLNEKMLELVESPKDNAVPIEVMILTQDHEIRGLVYVSRNTKEERRLTDLLNDPERRFLAVTDAELIVRNSPSTARHYTFLQIHIDKIIMLHPSTQRLVNNPGFSQEEASRFDDFRAKLRSR